MQDGEPTGPKQPALSVLSGDCWGLTMSLLPVSDLVALGKTHHEARAWAFKSGRCTLAAFLRESRDLGCRIARRFAAGGAHSLVLARPGQGQEAVGIWSFGSCCFTSPRGPKGNYVDVDIRFCFQWQYSFLGLMPTCTEKL